MKKTLKERLASANIKLTTRAGIRRTLAVLAIIFTLPFAIAEQPATADDTTHLIGEWVCNANQNDIYQINPDKTTRHLADKGTWMLSEKLLTISWENAYRLTIDTNQIGTTITGNSYPPGKNKPDILNFTRKVAINTKTPSPMLHADMPFDGRNVTYGNNLIVRTKNQVFAIETKGIPGDVDGKVRRIAYTIRRIGNLGSVEMIVEDVADERDKSHPTEVKCEFFKFNWSAGSNTKGYFYIKGQEETDKLPSDFEYYAEQLATLEDIDTRLDPTKWVKLMTGLPAPTAVAPAAQTMPVEHSVTDLKGRVLEGTITGKNDAEVSFTRNDGQKFTIKLDTLSKSDQAFIAGLVAPDPNAAKKPKVLLVVADGLTDGLTSADKKIMAWLKTSGFDVTIGYLREIPRAKNRPEKLGEWSVEAQRKLEEENVLKCTEKTILVDPVTRADSYDIVWITSIRNDYLGRQSTHSVAAYQAAKNGIIVAKIGIQVSQTRFVTKYIEAIESERYGVRVVDMENYVKVSGNFVLYDSSQPPRSEKSITEDVVLAKIRKALDDMLKK